MQNIVVAPKMLFIRQIYSNILKIDYISVTVDPVSRVESICQLVVAVCIDVSRDSHIDRKSTRLNSSHMSESRMPSSA